jgi:hypothetical protein
MKIRAKMKKKENMIPMNYFRALINIIEISNQSIKETVKRAVLSYSYDFENNIDQIEEQNNINRKFNFIWIINNLVEVPILQLQITLKGLMMNNSYDFNYHDAVLNELIGI